MHYGSIKSLSKLFPMFFIVYLAVCSNEFSFRFVSPIIVNPHFKVSGVLTLIVEWIDGKYILESAYIISLRYELTVRTA
jgi:hypothetical protein